MRTCFVRGKDFKFIRFWPPLTSEIQWNSLSSRSMMYCNSMRRKKNLPFLITLPEILRLGSHDWHYWWTDTLVIRLINYFNFSCSSFLSPLIWQSEIKSCSVWYSKDCNRLFPFDPEMFSSYTKVINNLGSSYFYCLQLTLQPSAKETVWRTVVA